MTKETYTTPLSAVRLWIHEADRVFSDRLVNETDAAKYDTLRAATVRKHFSELPQVCAPSFAVICISAHNLRLTCSCMLSSTVKIAILGSLGLTSMKLNHLSG